jgi:hypothetical protein
MCRPLNNVGSCINTVWTKVTFSILFVLLFQRAALALPPLVDLAVHLREEIACAKVSVATNPGGKG